MFFISKGLTKTIQNKTFKLSAMIGGGEWQGKKAWKNKYWLPEWKQKKGNEA